MERKRLKFIPRFTGAIEGWATNYINKNYWRIEAQHDFDDLLQDAYLYFLICVNRYPYVIEPAHFMALFKRCFINHINSLARQSSPIEAINILTLINPDNYGYLTVLLNEAPEEIKCLLRTIFDEKEASSFRAPCVRYKEGKKNSRAKRETTNEKFCRILGYDPKQINLVDMLRQYLG